MKCVRQYQTVTEPHKKGRVGDHLFIHRSAHGVPQQCDRCHNGCVVGHLQVHLKPKCFLSEVRSTSDMHVAVNCAECSARALTFTYAPSFSDPSRAVAVVGDRTV